MKNVMTTEQYDSAIQKIKRLQEIEKEFGREKMGPAMCWELELLMKEVQQYEDDRDLEMIRELEAWTR